MSIPTSKQNLLRAHRLALCGAFTTLIAVGLGWHVLGANHLYRSASSELKGTSDLSATHQRWSLPNQPFHTGALNVQSSDGEKAPQTAQASNVALPTEHVDLYRDVAGIREAAMEYAVGRHNAFFDEKAFLSDTRLRRDVTPQTLHMQLSDTSDLESLPSDVEYLRDKPQLIRERMAMIDMMEAMAADDSEALDALLALVLEPIDGSLSKHTLKAILGERYDIFAAAARLDWEATREVFAALDDQGMKDILRPALVRGLTDAEISDEEALQMTKDL